jgi:hypothetical protein
MTSDARLTARVADSRRPAAADSRRAPAWIEWLPVVLTRADERAQAALGRRGSTSGRVRASCVDAFSAGFRDTVAEDVCFDRAELPHLANRFDPHAKYATVPGADAIAARVR